MAQMERGDDIMLFDDKGKSLAFGKSHTLTIGVETQEVSTKDHGIIVARKEQKSIGALVLNTCTVKGLMIRYLIRWLLSSQSPFILARRRVKRLIRLLRTATLTRGNQIHQLKAP